MKKIFAAVFVLILLLPAFIDFVEARDCQAEHRGCMAVAEVRYFLCLQSGEEMGCYMAKMTDILRCDQELAGCGRCFHRTC